MQILENKRLGEKIATFTHASGMKFFVCEKPFSSCYCLLTVNYGANDFTYYDEKGNKQEMPLGVAHFLEHKMFENADGSDSTEHFCALGMDCNAYTSHTETSYLFSGAGDMENALRELLTFVLSPYYTKETVDKEQGIIGEEIARSLDSPTQLAYYKMMQNLYKTNPVREEILGSKESIAKITPELLYQAHNTFYNPANMILSISGKITPERVEEIANEILPQEKRECSFAQVKEEETAGVLNDYEEFEGPVAKPLFYIGIKDLNVPSERETKEKRQIVVDLLMQCLFSFSSPIISKLYEENKITMRYSCGYSASRNTSTLRLSMESDNPKEVAKLLSEYVESVKQNGIDEALFERYKKSSIADSIRIYDSTEAIVDEMNDTALDGSSPYSTAELVPNIKKEDLEKVLPELFVKENICMVVVNPRK